MMLQRAALEAVDRGDVDLFYDFPSRAMLAVYRRLGLSKVGEFARWVRPLKLDRIVEGRVPIPSLAKGISAVGNAFLSSRDTLMTQDPELDIYHWDRDVYDSFDDPSISGDGVQMRRSSAYLNWRYRADPRGGAQLLVAERHHDFAACLFWRDDGDDVTIVDGFGDEIALESLLVEVIERARATSATSMSVAISTEHPWVSTFEKIGFHRRESSPYIVYARSGVLDDSTPWFLMNGDRDL